MTQLLLLHHAQGRTPGVLALADDLRAAGHVAHVPDLYEGRVFDDLDDGVAHARAVGFDVVRERGLRAADDLPPDVVYLGMSLGNIAAQTLVQTRPGARACVLLHGALPQDALDGAWPAGVPGQVHVMEADDWGDVDDARALAAALPDVELHLYPGDAHLFTDRSLPAHDPQAAALVLERVLALLDRVG